MSQPVHRQMAGCPGVRLLVHEVVARHVVAGIEAVEVAVHARQFLFAVMGQRSAGFVLLAPGLFGRQLLGSIVGAGQGQRAFQTTCFEALARPRIVVVDQADLQRLDRKSVV